MPRKKTSPTNPMGFIKLETVTDKNGHQFTVEVRKCDGRINASAITRNSGRDWDSFQKKGDNKKFIKDIQERLKPFGGQAVIGQRTGAEGIKGSWVGKEIALEVTKYATNDDDEAVNKVKEIIERFHATLDADVIHVVPNAPAPETNESPQTQNPRPEENPQPAIDHDDARPVSQGNTQVSKGNDTEEEDCESDDNDDNDSSDSDIYASDSGDEDCESECDEEALENPSYDAGPSSSSINGLIKREDQDVVTSAVDKSKGKQKAESNNILGEIREKMRQLSQSEDVIARNGLISLPLACKLVNVEWKKMVYNTISRTKVLNEDLDQMYLLDTDPTEENVIALASKLAYVVKPRIFIYVKDDETLIKWSELKSKLGSRFPFNVVIYTKQNLNKTGGWDVPVTTLDFVQVLYRTLKTHAAQCLVQNELDFMSRLFQGDLEAAEQVVNHTLEVQSSPELQEFVSPAVKEANERRGAAGSWKPEFRTEKRHKQLLAEHYEESGIYIGTFDHGLGKYGKTDVTLGQRFGQHKKNDFPELRLIAFYPAEKTRDIELAISKRLKFLNRKVKHEKHREVFSLDENFDEDAAVEMTDEIYEKFRNNTENDLDKQIKLKELDIEMQEIERKNAKSQRRHELKKMRLEQELGVEAKLQLEKMRLEQQYLLEMKRMELEMQVQLERLRGLNGAG